MICGRFTLIIISSTLTFNLVDHICWATESFAREISIPQPSSTRVIANQAEIYSNQMTSNLDQVTKLENFALDSQTISSIPSNSSLETDEAATEINKLWLVAAMVVTSGLSLFLLRILFQKPVSKPEMKIKAKPAASMAVAMPSPSPRPQTNSLQQPNQVKQTQTPHHLHQGDSVLPRSLSWFPQGLSDEVSSSVYIPRHLSPGNGLKFRTDFGLVNTEHQAQPHTEQLPASDTLVSINSGENYIDVVAELTQDLKQSDRNIRRKAIWELAKLGDSRVIEPLMAIMPQASPVDKSLIIKAIKQITQRSVKPVNERLLQLLNDQNPQVRVNAILDLANFYQFVVPVTQRLEKMQFDEDPEVRLTAIRALNNLTQGYSVARLQDYADHQVGGMKVQDNDSAN